MGSKRRFDMVRFCAYAKNQYNAYMENKDISADAKEALKNALFTLVPSFLGTSIGNITVSVGNTPDNIKNFYRERGYFVDGNVYRVGVYSESDRFTDIIFVSARIFTSTSAAIILLVEKFED
jgi:hypothetical protein